MPNIANTLSKVLFNERRMEDIPVKNKTEVVHADLLGRRPSKQTLQVLNFMYTNRDKSFTRYRLIQELDLRSGVVYPMLTRLEERGLVTSSLAKDDHDNVRKEYSLTSQGISYTAHYRDVLVNAALTHGLI